MAAGDGLSVQRPDGGGEELDLRTLEETAKLFGVALPTVRGWVNGDDGCPVHTRGTNGKAYQLDVKAVIAWRKRKAKEKERAAEQKAERDAQLRLELLGDDMLEDAEGAKPLTPAERAAWLRGELDRVKLAQLRGELINADEARLKVAAGYNLARERLRALPDTLAGQLGLDEAQVVAMLEAIDATLDDLADDLEDLGKPDDLSAAA